MTPFEIDLAHDLDVEAQRFGDEWLFRWHSINVRNRVVDVEDFKGGCIRIGGVRFEGQPRAIYWRAVERYLSAKIHHVFQLWHRASKTYCEARSTSPQCTVNLLRGFSGRIVKRAADTDRRVRGRGNPESVPVFDASHASSRIETIIQNLERSHRQFTLKVNSNESSEDRDRPPEPGEIPSHEEFRIAADTTRRRILIEGMAKPISARREYDLLLFLIRSYREDCEKAPENHRSYLAAELVDEISTTSAVGVHRCVCAVRKKIENGFASQDRPVPKMNDIIETVVGKKGYRLNPHVRLIAPDQI